MRESQVPNHTCHCTDPPATLTAVTPSLIVREIPFRAGSDLILAEAASLFAWALEQGLEADPATWLRTEPHPRRLAVGLRLAACPESVPDGLEVAPAPTDKGELHPMSFDSFREGEARWIRIDHDPERGHPVAATAHAFPATTAP